MRVSLLAIAALAAACSVEESPREALGKKIFNDQGMSQPAGQACSDCHHPAFAFRDPESSRATSMGVMQGNFGSRNAPSAMYAAQVPPLAYDGRWHGGLFWDGRADTLEQQAAGPLLNPLEMHNPDRAAVVAHVRAAPYAQQFRDVYGRHALDDVDRAFENIGDALAAYQRGPELNPFNSRYDHFVAGTGSFTAQELRGKHIFDEHCASCHPPPLFTDHGYANLGIPRYDNNLYYLHDPQFVDHGLATTLRDNAEDGKFRTPTLRNVARTGPYGHNGYFENLRYMLDFLNTRDVGSSEVGNCSRKPGSNARCSWPAPEIPANVDRTVGNLGLSEDDLDALAAFLETLTDE
jgi:cytochrome c peroxidase